MPEKTARSRWFLLVFVTIAAFGLGLFAFQHFFVKKKIALDALHATLLEDSRPIPAFSLTGLDHQPFDNKSLSGHWTMMFFGFTHCGYMCPTTMAELGKMYRILQRDEQGDLPLVVMITVDPKRDSLERVEHYVQAFDPHFYGARGLAKSLHSMTKDLGIAYMSVPRKGAQGEDNDIEHTGSILLFNPQGELAAFFTTPHQGAQLARDYRVITQH